ncbi:MAG: vWA domain-containing protein [Elusimicrobiota bacterium]
MIFEAPYYLLFLIPLGYIVYLKLNQSPGSVEYSLTGYLKEAVRESNYSRYIHIFLRSLVLTLLIIALARPQRSLKDKSPVTPAVDIVLALDVSASMRALDFGAKNRMEAALIGASDFIKARRMDRIGIVVFSGVSLLHAPLTTDTRALLRLNDYIEADMLDNPGTAIGSGISMGLKYLKKADAPSQVIVLLSDGANNSGDIAPRTAARAAKAMDVKIYTIGCGRPGPAKVPVKHPDNQFKTRMVKVTDELDEETLKEIADNTGGKYFRATSLRKLEDIYAEIDKMEKRDVARAGYYGVAEIYHYFLYAGLLVIGLELILRFFKPGLFL